MKKYLLVEMPDFSVWRVPVQVIADAMTDYYVEKCGEDREKAKAETELLFTENEFEIEYWASENMDWDEVKSQGDSSADVVAASQIIMAHALTSMLDELIIMLGGLQD